MLKRWLVRFFKLGLILAFIGALALAVVVWQARAELPSFEELKSSPNGQMIRVRSKDGQIIQSLGPSFGRWIKFDDIPLVMKDAMVAVEDRRFYSHFGIDPKAVARSVYVRYKKGAFSQGGSTITQQLARNIFLNNDRNFGRKIREAVLALAMETKYSKQEIMELYLNKVYFGGGAYGIDSASRRFFDHSGEKLTLAEAAIIAGLVKAPSRYSPTADAEAAISRAGVVIGTMEEAGMITREEARKADPSSVRLAPEAPKTSAYYFLDWAVPQLDALIDEKETALDVYTTVDLSLQASAQNALRANVPPGAQGALVSMENDGAVRALVGGLDYRSSNYNRAFKAERQPGSAWKLFVYLAALEAGFTPDDTVVDEPVAIGDWQPRNSGDSYAGEMTVRGAFAYSKNTVAAQIGNEIGFGTISSMAKRLGITTPISREASMVLGTSEVRLIELTRAFAIVGNDGYDVEPYGISKVVTVDGDVLYEHEAVDPPQLVSTSVANGMTDLLASVVESGTGIGAQLDRPVAGKTGTTNSNKDGVFVGFSSGLTTGVWYGRDDAKAIDRLQGGRAPASAFADYMSFAVSNRPIKPFNFAMEQAYGPADEGEADIYGEEPERNSSDERFVDEYGMPIEERASENPSGGNGESYEEFLQRASGEGDAPQPTPGEPARALPAQGPIRRTVPTG